MENLIEKSIIRTTLNTELEIEIPDIDSDENNILMMIKRKSFHG